MSRSHKKKTQTIESQLQQSTQIHGNEPNTAYNTNTVYTTPNIPQISINQPIQSNTTVQSQSNSIDSYTNLLNHSFHRLTVYDYKLAETQQKLLNQQLIEKYNHEQLQHKSQRDKLLLHRSIKLQQQKFDSEHKHKQLHEQITASNGSNTHRNTVIDKPELIYQRKLNKSELKQLYNTQQLRQKQMEYDRNELMTIELADAKRKYEELQKLHNESQQHINNNTSYTNQATQSPNKSTVWKPWPEHKLCDRELAIRQQHIEQLGRAARKRSIKNKQKHKYTLTIESELHDNELYKLNTPVVNTTVPVQNKTKKKSALKQRPNTAAASTSTKHVAIKSAVPSSSVSIHNELTQRPNTALVRPKTSHGKRTVQTNVVPPAQSHTVTQHPLDDIDHEFQTRLDEYESKLKHRTKQLANPSTINTNNNPIDTINSIFQQLRQSIPSLNSIELERVKRQLQSHVVQSQPTHLKRSSIISRSQSNNTPITLPKRAVTTITDSQKKRSRKIKSAGTVNVYIPNTDRTQSQHTTYTQQSYPVNNNTVQNDMNTNTNDINGTQSSHCTPVHTIHDTVPSIDDQVDIDHDNDHVLTDISDNSDDENEPFYLQPSTQLQSLTNSTRHVSLAQQTISPLHASHTIQFNHNSINRLHRDSESSIHSTQINYEPTTQYNLNQSHTVVMKPVSMDIAADEQIVVEADYNAKYNEIEETKMMEDDIIDITQPIINAQNNALNAINSLQYRIQQTSN